MKAFELSSRKTKNGRRKFKAVLHEIFPDSCIDEEKEIGTQYNENGITWIKEYCEKALASIKGMSLRCEFIDEDRTTLCGHGETDIQDGLPIFENAVVIGTFSKGYIEEIETEENTKKIVCIGEGTIDSMCYNNFVKKLDDDIANGYAPNGSVEILKTEGNDSIIYKYGYKDKGRIPSVFEYSGYALLGVKPADESAKILELNKKEESDNMTENEIKNLVSQTVSELSEYSSEIDKCKKECEAKVSEVEKERDTLASEKNQLDASVEELKAALEKIQDEYKELDKKYQELWEERETLQKALGEAQAKERLGEMNSAIAEFSDDERNYAKAEIDAFSENPMEHEINEIVSKIYEGIGKKSKEMSKDDKEVSSEQNAANTVEDIFGEISNAPSNAEDTNIF